MSRNSEKHVSWSITIGQHVEIMVCRYTLPLCDGPKNCSASRIVLPQGRNESYDLRVVNIAVAVGAGRPKRPWTRMVAELWSLADLFVDGVVVQDSSDCPSSDSQTRLLDPLLINDVDVERSKPGKVAPGIEDHVV